MGVRRVVATPGPRPLAVARRHPQGTRGGCLVVTPGVVILLLVVVTRSRLR